MLNCLSDAYVPAQLRLSVELTDRRLNLNEELTTPDPGGAKPPCTDNLTSRSRRQLPSPFDYTTRSRSVYLTLIRPQ